MSKKLSLFSFVFVLAVLCFLLYCNYTMLTIQYQEKIQLTSCGIWDDVPSDRVLPESSPSLYSSKIWRRILENSVKVIPSERETKTFQDSYPLAGNMTDLIHRYRNGDSSFQIINPFPYKIILQPSLETCAQNGLNRGQRNEGVFLIILIKSHYNNFGRRNTIRKTWVNKKFMNRSICFHKVFLIGGFPTQVNVNFRKMLHAESKENGDLMQMNFYEFYYHNTWKTRGGLKWVEYAYPRAKYVVLVDDDYYMATDLLIQFLQTFESQLPPKLYMGYVGKGRKPYRVKGSRWYIDKKNFPYPVYPPFVHAGTVVMSMNFVKDFNMASQFTKHFIFDDVFIGIVASKLNVNALHNELFQLRHRSFVEAGFWKIISSHHYGHTRLLHEAWKCHIQLRNIREGSRHFIRL